MLHLMWYVRDRFCTLLGLDERGIETLDWILIGAIVTGVAAAIYTGLKGGLDTSVTAITSFTSTQIP